MGREGGGSCSPDGERSVYGAASSFSITHPAKVPSELSWARTELKLRRLATQIFVSVILTDIIIFIINILKSMLTPGCSIFSF